MKKNITLLLVLLTNFIFGQEIDIDGIILKKEKVATYELPADSTAKLYLKMNYGSSTIENPGDIKKLAGGKVEMVEIVFSDHPKGKTSRSLTRKRVGNLKN